MRAFQFDIAGICHPAEGYSEFDARVRLCNSLGIRWLTTEIRLWVSK